MSAAKTANMEILLTRTFEAPKELIFKVWTEQNHLIKWLCPKDFAVLFVELDFRVGGNWRSGMKAPDGEEYFMRGTYREIMPPDKLVFTHSWEDDKEPGHEPGHEALISVSLREINEGTEMTFHVTGLTSEESRNGQKQGWSEAFDNMNAALIDLVAASERGGD